MESNHDHTQIIRHQAKHAVDDAELVRIMQRANALAQQASAQQPYPLDVRTVYNMHKTHV